jgi:hypothetical protein
VEVIYELETNYHRIFYGRGTGRGIYLDRVPAP